MADEEQVRILREGVGAWNRWREQHPDVRPDLKKADLGGADLSEANLSEADLRGANIRLTNLTMSEFRGADLSGAECFNDFETTQPGF